MSNAIVRLMLNTADFDRNLKGSEGRMKAFEGKISFAKGALMKFAGGIGLAVTAGEAFNKVMNSSQTLGDLMASSISTAKESVDQFFYSLGSGEFKSFLNGLDDIISKSKEAYAAMDQLGNTRISHGYFSSKNNAQIQEAQYTAKNKFAPLEARMTAFGDWRAALDAQREINNTLKADLVKSIITAVEAEIGADNITVDFKDVEMALAIDVTNPLKRDELKSRYRSQYDDYRSQKKELENRKAITFGEEGAVKKRREEIDRQIEQLGNTYREAIIVNAMLEKYNDEQLKGIAGNASEYQNLSSSLNSISREYNETANEFNNANKAVKDFVKVLSLESYTTYSGSSSTGGGGGKTVPPPEGSLAELNKQITDAQKVYANAASDAARTAALKTIEELQNKKVTIEFQAKFPNAPELVSGRGSDRNLSGMAKLPDDIYNLPKFESPIKEEDISINEEYAETLGAIGNAFSLMGQAADANAASVLTWMSAMMQASAEVIDSASKVVGAKTAEGAASAGAEAAKTPVVGWLMVGAAIASALAAFASIPKFADGGIVGGSSKMGDRMVARVNAGEMILNTTQQGKLFDMINNGTIGGNIQVGGSVTVNGSKMMLAITNEMKKTGKRFPK